MSEHENQEQRESEAPRITDKRKVNKKQEPLPTAEELLEQTGGPSAFEQQQAEQANWDNLSDDEKQAILAQQAAAEEGLPFAGGGIQTEGETKKEVLTVFAIVVDLDGTATAMPLSVFEKMQDSITFERDADARIMYRSCSEILLDIQMADTAHMTLQMFKTVGDQMAAHQRAQALAQQLDKRGVRGKRG